MKRSKHMHGSILALAAMANEAINVHRAATRTNYTPRTFSDLGEDVQEVRYNGVLLALRGDTTPEQIHEQWRKDMHATGWTKGAATDSENKLNTNLIPYGDLPETLRIESKIFLNTVRNIAPIINP